MGVDEVIDEKPQNYTIKDEHEESKKKTALTKASSANILTSTPPKVADLSTNSHQQIVEEARKLANSCTSLKELQEAVKNFEGCALKKTATNTVFCDGNPEAKILFLGEAPGANEDIQGIPFCGESGKLLDNMISHIGLSRSKNVYITNSIFWRPPGNRKPTPQEIAICLPFVERHISLLAPKLIVLVGSTAVSSALGINEPISKMRQEFHSYSNSYLNSNVPVAIIFHPSYLLRQPSQKKLVWYDLLKIKHLIEEKGIEI